ncbi:HAD family hydrolase [Streptomyces sp. NPDC058391]|uniref:HAD family hydrolase n=1 Tax=Streptomyces sp. NPDC058391 TaxID=3346476 RepID=UPI00364FCA8C
MASLGAARARINQAMLERVAAGGRGDCGEFRVLRGELGLWFDQGPRAHIRTDPLARRPPPQGLRDRTEPGEEGDPKLWQEYVSLMAAAVTCRPEVLEGLARLRAAAWTIGVITNGASDIQRAKLVATGLVDLVDRVAVSGDLEIRKPDLRLFQLAASRCGADLVDGGWIVGDNPAGDIVGGHLTGLRTIWPRGRPWPDDLPAAHHVVDDITDAILFNETE